MMKHAVQNRSKISHRCSVVGLLLTLKAVAYDLQDFHSHQHSFSEGRSHPERDHSHLGRNVSTNASSDQ